MEPIWSLLILLLHVLRASASNSSSIVTVYDADDGNLTAEAPAGPNNGTIEIQEVVITGENDDLQTQGVTKVFDPVEAGCQLTHSDLDEIQSHRETVDRIVRHILTVDKGKTFSELGEFVDRFGSRMAGSANLEESLDYLLDEMKEKGLENVREEEVEVDRWIRGKEELTMLKPIKKKMAILGLGGAVSTARWGITADALVVTDFEDLERRKEQVKGKIVVYAFDYDGYDKCNKYRVWGASRASAHGAVGTLVKSLTDLSLYTPHTGIHNFDPNTTAIPAASITVEDADMLLRLSRRGKKIRLHLVMQEDTLPKNVSRNLVGELVGHGHPDQLVIIGGHTDSWDVGQGAMDDGGGVFISWRALEVLKTMGLRPKKTLRAVLFTAEEIDLVGAKAYYQAHQDEKDNISIAMESDFGTFKPLGLSLSTRSLKTRCVVNEILNMLSNIDANRLFLENDVPDLSFWNQDGVPTASLKTSNKRYFHYHHTGADTLNVMNSDHLDLCLALWTASSYVMANLESNFDRN